MLQESAFYIDFIRTFRNNFYQGAYTMNTLYYTPIGIIHSPFKSPAGTPIQSSASKEATGNIVIDDKYGKGLKDLENFSHIILLYHFHRSKKAELLVKPFLDTTKRGVFATRAPSRPNPIGLSVVRLLNINQNVLTVGHLDILDGTPLLDIKPYVPRFDVHHTQKNGWLESNVQNVDRTYDDGRFTE